MRHQVEISQRLRRSDPPWRRQVHVVLIGLIHHRHHPDSPRAPLLLCNIEANRESISPENWHVACCAKGGKPSLWAVPMQRAFKSEGVEPYGEGDTDHQQQELFVLVAAWLAADKVLRAGIRRDRHRAG